MGYLASVGNKTDAALRRAVVFGSVFFSSRRRHTRCSRDWSSDVCSSDLDEVDAKEAAFKAFKVAYDRESGYVGHKVSGEEFNVECTKFDKLVLVFKDGHYKIGRASCRERV